MTTTAEQNDLMIDAACDDLAASLQSDLDNPKWVHDVMSATERLCAVMDLLRHKLDGLHLH